MENIFTVSFDYKNMVYCGKLENIQSEEEIKTELVIPLPKDNYYHYW